jgi:hypothetical protein
MTPSPTIRHWVDHLSDIEENTAANTRELAAIAYRRVRDSVAECLEIYDKRHPPAKRFIVENEEDGDVMQIRIAGRITLQFGSGSTTFSRWIGAVQDDIEIVLDPDNVMWFELSSRTRMPVNDFVQRTLRPILFPAVQP